MKKFIFLLITLKFAVICMDIESRSEIEKIDDSIEFQHILSELDSEELYQSIPEDLMGAIPPKGFEEKYPYRMRLRKLQSKLNMLLTNNLSEDVLVKALDTTNYRKLDYEKLIDVLMSFKSDRLNLKIFSYVTSQRVKKFYKHQNIEYVIERLEDYVIDKFAISNILTGEYRKYALQHKTELLSRWGYLGHINKGVDTLIIERKIDEIKKIKREEPDNYDIWTTNFQEEYLNTFFQDNKRESFYFHWNENPENALSDLEIVHKQLLIE